MSAIAIYGTDPISKDESIKKHLSVWLNQTTIDALNVDTYSGTSLNFQSFAENYESNSLFCEKRASVIHQADRLKEDQQTKLLDILKQENPDHLVIFEAETWKKTSALGKWLTKKKGSLEEFKTPYSNQIPAWIQARAKEKYQRTITEKNALIVWELVGDHLGEIDMELRKLNDYIPAGKPITQEDIHQLMSSHRVSSHFELLKYFGLRKKKETLLILQQKLDMGDPPFLLAAPLFSHLIKLLSLKKLAQQGASPAEMANSIKLHEFVFKKENYLNQIQAWTEKEIKLALPVLAELEWKSKTGFYSQNFETTMLFASIL